jgi:hypothetical protein
MQPEQLSDKTKLLRAIRMMGFIILYALLEVAVSRAIPDQLATTVKNSILYSGLLALGLTLVLTVLILIGGMDFMSFTGEWKRQLFGIVSFFLSIKTAGLIGHTLALSIQPQSANDGIMTLYGFLFFIAGVIILAPFQFLAFRAYAKRKGIPYWPNLPKE